MFFLAPKGSQNAAKLEPRLNFFWSKIDAKNFRTFITAFWQISIKFSFPQAYQNRSKMARKDVQEQKRQFLGNVGFPMGKRRFLKAWSLQRKADLEEKALQTALARRVRKQTRKKCVSEASGPKMRPKMESR